MRCKVDEDRGCIISLVVPATKEMRCQLVSGVGALPQHGGRNEGGGGGGMREAAVQ